jgi:hypothetical protein
MKRFLTMTLALMGAAVLLAGCSTPRIDWTGRVGSYSYDDAVREYGPPEKSAKLTDGTLVADWLTYRGRPAVIRPSFYYSRWGSSSLGSYEPATPDYFLRLEFGPDGKLANHKSVIK